MARSRRFSPATKRRPFDKHSAVLELYQGQDINTATLQAEWARVPSGVQDPLTFYQEEENETLIRTAAYSSGRFDGGELFSVLGMKIMVSQGLIAVDSYVPGGGVPLDIPDPTFGVDAWIWRHQQTLLSDSTAFLTGDGSFAFDNRHGPESLIGSEAQRKLPQNKGILWVIAVEITANFGTGVVDTRVVTDMTFWLKDA